MNALTDKEIGKLTHQSNIPKHLLDWCIQVAQNSNPTEQQLITARIIINAKPKERLAHWVCEDQWCKQPEITKHKLKIK